MAKLATLARRLERNGFMVTYQRHTRRYWVGDGKGRYLGFVGYDATRDKYEVAFGASGAATAARDNDTAVKWFRVAAARLPQGVTSRG